MVGTALRQQEPDGLYGVAPQPLAQTVVRTFRSVRGLPVVTVAEGVHGGKLDDFLCSLDGFTVHGFRLRAPGFWSGETGVAASDVALLGRDYVLIAREAAIEQGTGSQDAGSRRAWWSDLVGTSVMARRGAELGKVEDVVLDDQPRVVRALVLEGGAVLPLRDTGNSTAIILGGDSVILDDESALLRIPDKVDSPEWWKAVATALTHGR